MPHLRVAKFGVADQQTALPLRIVRVLRRPARGDGQCGVAGFERLLRAVEQPAQRALDLRFGLSGNQAGSHAGKQPQVILQQRTGRDPVILPDQESLRFAQRRLVMEDGNVREFQRGGEIRRRFIEECQRAIDDLAFGVPVPHRNPRQHREDPQRPGARGTQ